MKTKQTERVLEMKKVKVIMTIILSIVFLATVATGVYVVVKTVTSNPLEGKWMNSSGNMGYEFHDEGKVTVTYFDGVIPILNIDVNGDIDGTYEYDKKEKVVTINYKYLSKTITKRYTYEVKKENLTLKDIDSGKANVYILQKEQNK